MLIPVLALAHADELPPCSAPSRPTAFLITMTPGNIVPTSFGHTGLLVHDAKLSGRSPIYDHGHYDARDPWFAVDYALQRAEYWSKRRTLGQVARIYKQLGRDLIAQELDLTPEEVAALQADQEALVAGGSFRYHWFHENCTTRVRDSLDRVLDGSLHASMREAPGRNVRDQVLGHSTGGVLAPVLAWGAGTLASSPIDAWTAAFLPASLMDGLAQAHRADGRPLVIQTCRMVDGNDALAPERAPDQRGSLATVGAVAAGSLGLLGYLPYLGRAAIALFALALCVVAGIDLFGFAVGAGAPWWTHHNQALANPLAFAFVLRALGMRQARPFTWLVVAVATLASVLALLRGFPNHDAGPIALVLPGLWASLLHLERLDRRSE